MKKKQGGGSKESEQGIRIDCGRGQVGGFLARLLGSDMYITFRMKRFVVCTPILIKTFRWSKSQGT